MTDKNYTEIYLLTLDVGDFKDIRTNFTSIQAEKHIFESSVVVCRTKKNSRKRQANQKIYIKKSVIYTLNCDMFFSENYC